MNYENFDVIIGIDRRGVVHVLKHRTASLRDVEAEVKLTTTITRTDTFTSEEKDTGLLVPNTIRAVEIGVSPPDIREVIERAISENRWVRISGKRQDGSCYLVRPILPRQIRTGGLSLVEYVDCHDGKSGERRSFRLERITRAELGDAAA